jgi:hypothetical protein
MQLQSRIPLLIPNADRIFKDSQTNERENKRTPKDSERKEAGEHLYLSFSTTLMTEMLKVVNHASRLIMSTPPSAFCL